jgi:hypothetical protein
MNSRFLFASPCIRQGKPPVTGGFGAVPGAAPQRGDGGGVGRGGGAEGGENFFEKFGAVPVTGRNAAKLARIFYFFSEPIFFFSFIFFQSQFFFSYSRSLLTGDGQEIVEDGSICNVFACRR